MGVLPLALACGHLIEIRGVVAWKVHAAGMWEERCMHGALFAHSRAV